MVESLTSRLKERQLSFFAFLNKEFNTLNYKSTNCSMHCFDNVNVPMKSVNECLSVCRVGIGEARKFAQDLQGTAEEDLHKCVERGSELKNMKDPIINWMSCHEKLILNFDQIEKDISEEYSNYV